MPFNAIRALEIAPGTVVVAGLGAAVDWMLLRKRPSEEELEVTRRQLLTQSERLRDGPFLDVHRVPAHHVRTLAVLRYEHREEGVDYDCASDVSRLQDGVPVA